MFPTLGCVPPSCEQKPHGSESAALLDGFANSLATKTSQWRPAPDEQNALSTAIAALQSTRPEFNAPPHATWFAEYGCVLLANVPRVGTVQLQLVCLDEWSYRMHSAEHGRAHTAEARLDTYKLDHVGLLNLEDYSDFLYARATSPTRALLRSKRCPSQTNPVPLPNQARRPTQTQAPRSYILPA